MNERYWLRERGCAWQQATQEQFINAERRAGFRPKSGRGVATGGFSSSSASSEGRVTYGEITEKDYGHDPDFLAVAKQAQALEKLKTLRPVSGTDPDFDYQRGVLKN